MALVKCPECESRISDRAHSCPFCGFPLDEYYAEINEARLREEEAKKREEELLNISIRKKKYSEKHDFLFLGNSICLDENERICAFVGFTFQCVQDKLHENLQIALLSSDTPSDYNKNNFGNYVDRLLHTFQDEIINRACFISEKFLDENSQEFEVFESEILDNVDLSQYYRLLCDIYAELYSDYEINVDNAHMQYHDDFYAAGTPVKPIDEVYSDTLLGLIGPGIAARLVNGAVAAITDKTIKPREKEASNKFYNTVIAEKLKLDVKILSVADGFIDEIVLLYKECVLNYLISTNVIFEISSFPKKNYSYQDVVEYLSDEAYTNENKKKAAVDYIVNNPADFTIYAMVLTYLSYSVEDAVELKKLIKYFEIQDQVGNLLSKINTPAIRLLELDEITSADIKAATMESKTYNKRQFSSLEKKERYIREEKIYGSNLKNFYEDTRWFDKGSLSAKCKNLQNIGRPTFEKWQEDYDRALELANYLNDKVVVEPMSKIASAIVNLRKAEKVVFSFSANDFRNSDWKENQLLEGCHDSLEEDELPIVIIRNYAEKLIITTRYFYYCKTSKLIKKFGLDEIEAVYIHRKTIIDPASIVINVFGDETVYRIFANDFPENAFDILAQFAEKLKRYAEESPLTKSRHIEAIFKNTSYDKLTDEGLDSQLDLIARIKCVINAMPCKDAERKLMKWTYEVDSALMSIVKKSKIGHEYILYRDVNYIVTEQAVYIRDKYDNSGKNFKRYSFDEYEEIIPVVLICNYYTEYSLLQAKKDDYRITSIKPMSINEFKNAIHAVYTARKSLDLCESKFMDKNFLFCSKCFRMHDGYDGKLKKCPSCGAKLSNNGWKGIWNSDDLNISFEKEKLNYYKEILFVDKEIINELAASERKVKEQQETVFCLYCGKQILRRVKFCNFCGKENSYGKEKQV